LSSVWRSMVSHFRGVVIAFSVVFGSASFAQAQAPLGPIEYEADSEFSYCIGWSAKANTMLCIELHETVCCTEYTAVFVKMPRGKTKRLRLLSGSDSAGGAKKRHPGNLKKVNREIKKKNYQRVGPISSRSRYTQVAPGVSIGWASKTQYTLLVYGTVKERINFDAEWVHHVVAYRAGKGRLVVVASSGGGEGIVHKTKWLTWTYPTQ
jgi:hypothetical protein